MVIFPLPSVKKPRPRIPGFPTQRHRPLHHQLVESYLQNRVIWKCFIPPKYLPVENPHFHLAGALVTHQLWNDQLAMDSTFVKEKTKLFLVSGLKDMVSPMSWGYDSVPVHCLSCFTYHPLLWCLPPTGNILPETLPFNTSVPVAGWRVRWKDLGREQLCKCWPLQNNPALTNNPYNKHQRIDSRLTWPIQPCATTEHNSKERNCLEFLEFGDNPVTRKEF